MTRIYLIDTCEIVLMAFYFTKSLMVVGEGSEWCSHFKQLSPRGNKMDILIDKN